MSTKTVTASIIAGLFLIGCGGTVTDTNEEKVLSIPHQVDMTPKSSRELDPAGTEYLNFMKSYNLNSRIFTIQKGETTLNDLEGRDQNLKYVFYYDSDHDKHSGYADPWVPNVGADYLYENGVMYKYTGTPGSHEWSWEATNYNVDRNAPNHYHGLIGSLGYGIALNPDWTQNQFLGFYDTLTSYLETSFNFNQWTDRYFRVTEDEDTVYLHSFKKDKQKLDRNEKYYNYTFSINDSTYHTEGNILLNSNGEIIADNLIYEVRTYDTVTLIPKRLLIAGTVKINEMIIRDANWEQLQAVNGGVAISTVYTKEELKALIEIYEDIRNLDVSPITNMSGLFQNNHEFNQDISAWDVSNVTTMFGMFQNANFFNQDISGWDVSNVTSMVVMFSNAHAFNQPIGNWNVSNVTHMNSMFVDTQSFNQPIGNWDMSSVTDISNMFRRTKSFNQDISTWDVSSVTNMLGLFHQSKVFNQNINTWNVSSVTNMRNMFYETEAFNQPLENWNTSNVTDMYSMFRDNHIFNQDISNWDVSHITEHDYFDEGSALSENYKPHFR